MTHGELRDYIQNAILMGQLVNVDSLQDLRETFLNMEFISSFNGSAEYNGMYFKINKNNKIVLTLCRNDYECLDLWDAIDIIGVEAFFGNDTVKELMAKSVTEIETRAFAHSSISYVDMNSLRKIHTSAFERSELIEIQAPNLITVQDYCFWGCEKLVTIDAPKLRCANENVFTHCQSLDENSKHLATFLSYQNYKKSYK